jgi:hypothetical protein
VQVMLDRIDEAVFVASRRSEGRLPRTSNKWR